MNEPHKPKLTDYLTEALAKRIRTAANWVSPPALPRAGAGDVRAGPWQWTPPVCLTAGDEN